MNPGMLLLVTAVVLLLVILVGRKPFKAYWNLRSTRVVTCPETQNPAAVHLKAGLAAAVAPGARLDLASCSRWPERQDCGRECLAQIGDDEEGCMVRNLVRDWYAGKKCIYCERPFGIVPSIEHRPALAMPGSAPVQWSQFRPEELPDVFTKYEPVCWDCYVSESLRASHPGLVTERS